VARGGSRPNAGRKPGKPNKRTAELQAEVAATGETPIDYMLRVMRDRSVEHDRRDDMAKAAAPYIHPKLAAIEHTGKDGGPIETHELSDTEAARRIAFTLAKQRQAKQLTH
jgi:hypothetical protein